MAAEVLAESSEDGEASRGRFVLPPATGPASDSGPGSVWRARCRVRLCPAVSDRPAPDRLPIWLRQCAPPAKLTEGQNVLALLQRRKPAVSPSMGTSWETERAASVASSALRKMSSRWLEPAN